MVTALDLVLSSADHAGSATNGQPGIMPSTEEKWKPASRDIEPQGGFPHVHDSLDQLRPAGSGPVAPGANPAPNADLETYQSLRAKAGRDPAAHIRMALWCEQHGLNAEKLKHLALAVLKDPQNTMRGD